MKNVETSTDLVLFFGIGQALVTDVFENILSSKCTNSLEDGMHLSRTDFCIDIIIMIMSLHRSKSETDVSPKLQIKLTTGNTVE